MEKSQSELHEEFLDMCGTTSENPRAFTAEEVREQFVKHVLNMCNYWGRLPDKSAQEHIEGVAFSILVALDGDTMALPGFSVIPSPHPDDRMFLSGLGKNFYPEIELPIDACDISGSLHEEFSRICREVKERQNGKT